MISLLALAVAVLNVSLYTITITIDHTCMHTYIRMQKYFSSLNRINISTEEIVYQQQHNAKIHRLTYMPTTKNTNVHACIHMKIKRTCPKRQWYRCQNYDTWQQILT